MNTPTSIVALVVSAVFVAIIAKAVLHRQRRKKAGVGANCGGGCAGCGMRGQCH